MNKILNCFFTFLFFLVFNANAQPYLIENYNSEPISMDSYNNINFIIKTTIKIILLFLALILFKEYIILRLELLIMDVLKVI